MTAQVPNTNVVQSIRIDLPVQAMKAVIGHMIDQKQRRAFQDIPDHLKNQALAAAMTEEEIARDH